jgi:hypothetical protein
MSANLQPIPLGLIAIKPFIDFIVGAGQPMEAGDTDYQSDSFSANPSVFIDGLLLTYVVSTDRRYVSYNGSTKTITINGSVNEGENVQIFL